MEAQAVVAEAGDVVALAGAGVGHMVEVSAPKTVLTKLCGNGATLVLV